MFLNKYALVRSMPRKKVAAIMKKKKMKDSRQREKFAENDFRLSKFTFCCWTNECGLTQMRYVCPQ